MKPKNDVRAGAAAADDRRRFSDDRRESAATGTAAGHQPRSASCKVAILISLIKHNSAKWPLL